MEQPQVYKDVTLLITHYNRSSSLERLLKAFMDIGAWFEDIVVSDDCSREEHLDRVKALQNEFSFRLITTPENKGLGHNINKGQDAVKTRYTLYVQEDFVPKKAFSVYFSKALSFIRERKDIDIINLYAYTSYPVLKPYKDGFSEMVFSNWNLSLRKFFYYSDHPHLRRSDFLEKFGRYREGVSVDVSEYAMCISFIREKGKGLFFDNFWELFEQRNSPDEPSVAERSNWRQSNSFLVNVLRFLYHRYKFIKGTILIMRRS